MTVQSYSGWGQVHAEVSRIKRLGGWRSYLLDKNLILSSEVLKTWTMALISSTKQTIPRCSSSVTRARLQKTSYWAIGTTSSHRRAALNPTLLLLISLIISVRRCDLVNCRTRRVSDSRGYCSNEWVVLGGRKTYVNFSHVADTRLCG